jgi:hypothetical protein
MDYPVDSCTGHRTEVSKLLKSITSYASNATNKVSWLETRSIHASDLEPFEKWLYQRKCHDVRQQAMITMICATNIIKCS